MSDKRESRSRRQPEAGQGENAAFGRAAFSDADFTTSPSNRQRLVKFLGCGKSSAITGRELAERLGLADTREVSRMVERERNSFIPICATCDPSNAGYYLPADVAELSEYNRILKRRIRAITRTQKAIETALERMCGQETVEGWSDG